MTTPGPGLDSSLREMLRDVPAHDDTAQRATIEAIETTRQRGFRWLPPFRSGGAIVGRRLYAGLAASVMVVAVVGILAMSFGERPAGPGGTRGMLLPTEIFEGRIGCGPSITSYSSTDGGAVGQDGARITQDRGAAYALTIESMSDARLLGTLIDQLDTDRYGMAVDAPEVGALTWTLENDDGRWQTRFVSFKISPSDWSTAAARWDGSGAYEGLSALMTLDYQPVTETGGCGWEVSGYIVSDELLPDFPTPKETSSGLASP